MIRYFLIVAFMFCGVFCPDDNDDDDDGGGRHPNTSEFSLAV
jgi:hypothetical protein